MKSADPYPVIPAGIAGIQAPGMAAVGVESLSRATGLLGFLQRRNHM